MLYCFSSLKPSQGTSAPFPLQTNKTLTTSELLPIPSLPDYLPKRTTFLVTVVLEDGGP